MKKIQTKYGSVLVFSLIVLFIGVVAALGIAATTLISQKMSGRTGKSVSSFQIADSAAEIVLKKMKDNPSSTIGGVFACNNGVVSGSIETGKNYQVTFLSETATLGCEDNVSEVTRIKSIGTYANTTRAIEAAVAAASCPTGLVDTGSDYCIEGTESSTATFISAASNCGNKGFRLCSPSEWYYACTKKSSLNPQLTITNPEWVDDIVYNTEIRYVVIGSSCSVITNSQSGSPKNYRCCANKQ
jgi:Tfp pilus assembly protein PilX